MQVRCRVLDIIMFILTRAAFCGEHATAVDFFEIPIGKFIVSLGILGFFVVESQIPFAVFGKPVQANEFIILLRGWPVLTPCISLVVYKFSFVDTCSGLLKCSLVKRHGHGCSPLPVVRFAEGGSSLTDKARRTLP